MQNNTYLKNYIYVSVSLLVCEYTCICACVHVVEVYKTIDFEQDFITQTNFSFAVQHFELNFTVMGCFPVGSHSLIALSLSMLCSLVSK